MSDKVYIYGDSNGAIYDGAECLRDHVHGVGNCPRQTHWDPRVEVSGFAHTVQVGIVPASAKSSDDGGIWDPNDGQFLSLSRDGCNRLIRAVREARIAMYGEDE